MSVINDLSKRDDDLNKLIKTEKYLYVNRFLKFDKPYALIKNINNDSLTIEKYKTAEIDSLQKNLLKLSTKMIIID